MQALAGQLEQLRSSIDSTQQCMAAALSSQAAAAGQALSSAQASQAASAEVLGQALQAAGKDLSAAFDSLCSSLTAQSAQLVALSQQQQEAAAAAQATAAAGLARAQESLRFVGAGVQQLQGVADNTAEAVNTKLAAFAADFEASMVQKQQVLVAQLGQLLAGFAQDRQQVVAAAVAEVQQQLVAGQQELSTAAAGATAAVDGCMTQVKVRLYATGLPPNTPAVSAAGAISSGARQWLSPCCTCLVAWIQRPADFRLLCSLVVWVLLPLRLLMLRPSSPPRSCSRACLLA
jgi:hypothetical protein